MVVSVHLELHNMLEINIMKSSTKFSDKVIVHPEFYTFKGGKFHEMYNSTNLSDLKNNFAWTQFMSYSMCLFFTF